MSPSDLTPVVHGRHRSVRVYRWSRALIPGWVAWTQGRRVAGVLGLLLFFLLTGAVVAVAVVGYLHPDMFASLLTSRAKLTQLLVGVSIVGAVYVVAALAGLVGLRGDARFRRTRWGAFVLTLATLAQTAGFTAAAYGVNLQRGVVDKLLAQSRAGSVFVAAPGVDAGTNPLESAPELHGVINVLLLGGDAGKNRWGLRPDSISVANINLDTGRIVMVGIPRNLQQAPFSEGSPMRRPWPRGFNCGNTCLINAIYTYATGHDFLYADEKYAGKDPGILAMREAVQGVTGLTVDYYVLIDMLGFRRLVDAVDGVTVCIPKRTVTQYGKVYEAGCQHMNGRNALLYARTRHDSSDYTRMTRQRLVQESLLRQVNGVKLLKAYQEVALHGSEYIETDIPEDVAAGLLRVAVRSANAPFSSLELVPPRISTSNPNFSRIHEMVAEAVAAP